MSMNTVVPANLIKLVIMPRCHILPALLMLPMVATFAATRVPLLELHACPRAPPMRALALSQRAPQRTPAAGGAVQQHNSRSSGLGAVALRRALRRLPSVLVGALIIPRLALASSAGGVTLSSGPLSQPQLVVRMIIWFFLFSMAALFAGAETAITTLWPWKVKQLAAEGGDSFQLVSLFTSHLIIVQGPLYPCVLLQWSVGLHLSKETCRFLRVGALYYSLLARGDSTVDSLRDGTAWKTSV